MPTIDTFYAECKQDLELLSSPLFAASEVFVRNRGAFLPHGAVLTSARELRIIVAAPDEFEQRAVSATEVLPLLHQALRMAASEEGSIALAVAEDVTITPEGQKPTQAVKVLVEHQRGFAVAFYLPFRRKLLWGYVPGQLLVLPAEPEVRVWPSIAT